MAGPVRDKWAEWLLERRFGGDSGQQESFLAGPYSEECRREEGRDPA